MVKFLHFKTMALLLLMIVGASSAWAEEKTNVSTVSTSFSATGTVTGNFTQTGDYTTAVWNLDVTWKSGASWQAMNNTKGSQVGSGSKPASSIVLTGTNIPGTIKSVIVNSSVASEGETTVGVTVGNTSFQCNNSNTATLQTSAANYTFTGSGSGDVVLTWTQSSTSKAIYIKSVTITYEETVVKTDPTITFNNGSVRVGKKLDLSTLFTSNSTGAVTYSITNGGSYATLSNSVLTATAEGTVTVKAEQAATNTHNAGEATATITVNAALTLSSIAITTAPTKTTYNEGETFNATGMVVTATYSDNSTDDVTALCTFSPDRALTTSDTEITVSYTENGVTKTATQAITVNEVVDYATLPFNWAGGSSSALKALTGVTTSGLGSDYSASDHSPYLVKLDGTGDYIQVKTNGQPGDVTIGVKMIGGSNASSITVQESSDGETFTDVEVLTISGSQNNVLTLETSNSFTSDSRYVRLVFTKGSNVGVGPISIATAPTDPVINCNTTVNLRFDATEGEIDYSIINPVDGTQLSAVSNNEWISNINVGSDKITFNTTTNTGNARTGIITLSYGQLNKTVEVVQAKYTYTYRMATEVVPGRHYIITNGDNIALGAQGNNNRGESAVDVENNLITIGSDYVAELVLGIDSETGFITLFDESGDPNGGYLYAASNSSNHLKVQAENNDNGKWTVFFNNDGSVKIVAQGTNSRNTLQYNGTNHLFSCYNGGQGAVYLYERVNDAGDVTGVTAPVQVSSAEYATIYKPYALGFSGTGIKAYTSTDNGSSVRLTEITSGQVPANTPVVLYKDGGATANVPVIASADAVGSNDLRVSTGENPTNAYVLAKPSGQPVGFYLWDSSATLNAGKVYLQANSSTGNARQFLPFGETTAIENVNVSKTLNGEVFDLQGRRVAQPQKGLYIVNGRKVVIK